MAKIVVVTGAGAGVGRAVVTEFARNGYDVALLSRDPGSSRPIAAPNWSGLTSIRRQSSGTRVSGAIVAPSPW